MKCFVSKELLVSSLKIIKASKAMDKVNLGKSETNNEICLKVSFDKDENKIVFLSSNIGVWVSSIILGSSLKIEEVFAVEESGEIYLESKNFISLIETFPEDSVIQLETLTGSTDLNASIYKTDKKGKTKNIVFPSMIKPNFFSESPPNEDRKVVKVSANSLVEAINCVEFASDSDPVRQHLWGVNLEIYGHNEIASCSTDTHRLCWFDTKGIDRNSEPIVFTPIKSSLVSCIKSLDKEKPVIIRIGSRYSVLEQDNQWHGIPNTMQIGDDVMPAWRSIVKALKGKCNYYVDIPRKGLSDCLKTVSVSGGKFYAKIIFDYSEENYSVSLNSFDGNSTFKCLIEEKEPLKKENFSCDFKISVSFLTDLLREVVNKYKSDYIRFYLQGDDQSVIIVDEKESYQYLSTVVRDVN